MTTETRVEDGIVKRHGSRGATYCVRYRVGGRSKRKAFRTLKEARRFLADTKTSVLTGHFIDPAKREMTMDAWLDDFEAAMRGSVWSEDHGTDQVALIAKHIRPTFGSMPIAAVQQIDVQKWLSGLIGKGYKPNSIERFYNTLNKVFGTAKRNGIIPTNPCAGTKRPKVSKAVTNVLGDDDVVKIAQVIDPRFELAVWLGATAGLRIGEILGLTLDQVDFENGTIEVDRQWLSSGRFGPTKTRTSRTVEVGDDLLTRIRLHVAAYGVTRAGTLFGRTKAPIAHSNFYSAVWAPVKALGFAEDCDSPHALRHHFASVLIEAKENPKFVQRQLGHATLSQTMDTYTHLFKRTERRQDHFAGRYAPILRVAS